MRQQVQVGFTTALYTRHLVSRLNGDFLFSINDDNQEEFFQLLSNLIPLEEYNAKIVTNRENIASATPSDLLRLMPCNQEKVDTRMSLHAADGNAEGCRTIVI